MGHETICKECGKPCQPMSKKAMIQSILQMVKCQDQSLPYNTNITWAQWDAIYHWIKKQV